MPLTSRRQPLALVEPLEIRSLLSALPLSGFPAGGFRTDRLDGSPPWDVAIVVDGQPVMARAYAETTENTSDAPRPDVTLGSANWIAGIIGDTRLNTPDAAVNDVDLYRLELPGHDHYAVSLAVFSQRFGSTLDGAVSLFDAAGHLIASNDDAFDPRFPSEAALQLGLDGGSYLVAVSTSGNLPNTPGGFDPLNPGSGQLSAGSTGPYLLRIAAAIDNTRPFVEAASFDPGSTFSEPPGRLSLRFSEDMSLSGLAAGAELTDDLGQRIALGVLDYDPATHTVSYVLLDRPTSGNYTLTLHANSMTDLAGNPLDSGGSDADFTLQFQVRADTPSRVDNGDNDTIDTAQALGLIFPSELKGGVAVSGQFALSPENSTTGDHHFYRFEVSLRGIYAFRLRSGDGSSVTGDQLNLYDTSGHLIAHAKALPWSGANLYRVLPAGQYVVEAVAPASQSPGGAYRLVLQSVGMAEVPALLAAPDAAEIQVVLRSDEGVASQPTVAGSTTSSLASASESMTSAVEALPAVGSQPIGVPKAPQADPSAIAWAGHAPDGAGVEQRGVLPTGFVLGKDASQSVTSVTVARVSGSFQDPLPDAIPHGTYALSPSTRSIAELAELAGARAGSDIAGQVKAASVEVSFGGDAGDDLIGFAAHEAQSESVQLASSPPAVSLGVVAGIGAASMMTVPNRRRTSNWFQRAFGSGTVC